MKLHYRTYDASRSHSQNAKHARVPFSAANVRASSQQALPRPYLDLISREVEYIYTHVCVGDQLIVGKGLGSTHCRATCSGLACVLAVNQRVPAGAVPRRAAGLAGLREGALPGHAMPSRAAVAMVSGVCRLGIRVGEGRRRSQVNEGSYPRVSDVRGNWPPATLQAPLARQPGRLAVHNNYQAVAHGLAPPCAARPACCLTYVLDRVR